MCICAFAITEVYDLAGFWLIWRSFVYSWAGNSQSDLATHAIYTRYDMPYESLDSKESKGISLLIW